VTLANYYPGKNIMHHLLPQIVQEHDPDCFYWPSSPYGGDDHNGSQAGDKHNWQTWHAIVDRPFGVKPLTIADAEDPAQAISYWHLGTDQGRFISEFGIHGSPVLETLRRNIPSEGLAYHAPQMIFRNRNVIKDRGDLMIQAHTGLPTSLEDYIDYSMMVQAEGLKYGIEHYRRRKFHCSGALFWQWNDNWPSITWSVLDYYRFPKAGYFFVKRAFAPVMFSVQRRANGIYSIWGVNDTLLPIREALNWVHLNFDGTVHQQDTLLAEIPANTACELQRFQPELFRTARTNEMLWLQPGNPVIPANRWFFAPELRDLQRAKPALQVQWTQAANHLQAHLVSDAHAYFVNLFVPLEGTRYSDNWIDLYPGREQTIDIWHPEGKLPAPDEIEIKWR
jgi:beta-mannosidase